MDNRHDSKQQSLEKIRQKSAKKNPSQAVIRSKSKSKSPVKRKPSQHCYILYGLPSSQKQSLHTILPSGNSLEGGNLQVRFEQDQYNIFRQQYTSSTRKSRMGESPDAKGHYMLESASEECNLNLFPERCSSQKVFKSRT